MSVGEAYVGTKASVRDVDVAPTKETFVCRGDEAFFKTVRVGVSEFFTVVYFPKLN